MARLAIVVLAVRDLPSSVAFYEAALGWRRVVDAPSYVELAGEDGAGLGLYEATGYARNLGTSVAVLGEGPCGPTEIYVRVEDARALDARLETAGARRVSGRRMRDWGEEVAYFVDLDRNVIAVAQAGRASSP